MKWTILLPFLLGQPVGALRGGHEQHQEPQRRHLSSTVAQVGKILSLRLIDATMDRPLASYTPLLNSSVIALSTLPTRSFNIEAITEGGRVGSVVFATSNHRFTENFAPWAFCGNKGSEFHTCNVLVAGFNESIVVTPYSMPNGQGVKGCPFSLDLHLLGGEPSPTAPAPAPVANPTLKPTEKPALSPASKPSLPPMSPVTPMEPVTLTLINADTDQDMGTLHQRSEFVIGLVETPHINIRADFDPSLNAPVGSVVFSSRNLSPSSGRQYPLANDAPFTASGYIQNTTTGSIDYRSLLITPSDGDQLIVVAQVFSGKNGTGTLLYRISGKIRLVGSINDKTPPQLVSLKALSATTVDLSKGPSEITFEIAVQDDYSGVKSGLMEFAGSTSTRLLQGFESDPKVRGRPVTANVTFRIGQNFPVGTYPLQIQLADVGWNHVFITAQDLLDRNFPATIHITKGEPISNKDVTPPAFLGMKALGSTNIYSTTVTVPTTGPPVVLPFKVTVQDDHSGFAQASLSSGLGEVVYEANPPIVGQPVTFFLNFTVTPEQSKGPYWLVLRLRDGANNTHVMPSSALQGKYAPGTFVVAETGSW